MNIALGRILNTGSQKDREVIIIRGIVDIIFIY